MLEIILLIFLTRKVGEIVESKGRRAVWFKVLSVVLWIGGEFIGGFVGGVIGALAGWDGMLPVYLVALAGAGLGALVAFIIAHSVSPVGYDAPPPPPTFG